MRPTAIGFASKKLTLEGVLTVPQGIAGPYPGLLVCHPHPVLGGNMDHPVVTTICRMADEQGIATLRFNFRGVGDSEGLFSNGSGEKEDAKSALNVLKRWPGIDSKKLAIVGYSFGASVLLDGLSKYKAARTLVFIAPPISAVENSKIHKDKRPKMFLVGQKDRISPSVELQRVLDDVRAPVQFAEIPNADHGMRSHERELADRVSAFAVTTLNRTMQSN